MLTMLVHDSFWDIEMCLTTWQTLICDLQRALFSQTGTTDLTKTNRATSVNLDVMWPSLKWNSADVRRRQKKKKKKKKTSNMDY